MKDILFLAVLNIAPLFVVKIIFLSTVVVIPPKVETKFSEELDVPCTLLINIVSFIPASANIDIASTSFL